MLMKFLGIHSSLQVLSKHAMITIDLRLLDLLSEPIQRHFKSVSVAICLIYLSLVRLSLTSLSSIKRQKQVKREVQTETSMPDNQLTLCCISYRKRSSSAATWHASLSYSIFLWRSSEISLRNDRNRLSFWLLTYLVDS